MLACARAGGIKVSGWFSVEAGRCDGVDGLAKPLAGGRKVRQHRGLIVDFGLCSGICIGELPSVHGTQRKGWPGLLLSPIEGAYAEVVQALQIWAGTPQQLQVDQVMRPDIDGVCDGMQFLGNLVFEADQLDWLQFTESEVGTKLCQFPVDLVSSVRVGIDLRVGHFDIERAPGGAEERD